MRTRRLRFVRAATRCVCRRAMIASVVPLIACTAVPLAASAAGGAPATSATRFDAASKGFGLNMTLELTQRWRVLPTQAGGPPAGEAIGLVHVGVPPSDESQWWGPDILIVDGARVHRPADVVSPRPAKPDRSVFVPWPSSLFGYLASLPGVKVLGRPQPVTIGGIRGTQFTVGTPSMHPLFWLDGDTAWLGGGPTGVDPPMTRRLILLTVRGKQLLLAYGDVPASFAKRWPAMRQLFGSIEF